MTLISTIFFDFFTFFLSLVLIGKIYRTLEPNAWKLPKKKVFKVFKNVIKSVSIVFEILPQSTCFVLIPVSEFWGSTSTIAEHSASFSGRASFSIVAFAYFINTKSYLYGVRNIIQASKIKERSKLYCKSEKNVSTRWRTWVTSLLPNEVELDQFVAIASTPIA